MVPVPQAVKAENDGGGSEKPDYRNLWRVLPFSFCGVSQE